MKTTIISYKNVQEELKSLADSKNARMTEYANKAVKDDLPKILGKLRAAATVGCYSKTIGLDDINCNMTLLIVALKKEGLAVSVTELSLRQDPSKITVSW